MGSSFSLKGRSSQDEKAQRPFAIVRDLGRAFLWGKSEASAIYFYFFMSSARVVSKFVPRSAKACNTRESVDGMVIYHLAAELEQADDAGGMREEHLVLVQQGVDPSNRILIFAINAGVYVSSNNSTFVHISKVDSTGYDTKLRLDSGGSLIQNIVSGLVYSIYSRINTGQFFVNVCSRHNPEYLFTNSGKNNRKHIIKDAKLISWWVKTLDRVSAILESFSSSKILKHLYVPAEESSSLLRYCPRGKETGWKWGYSPLYNLDSPAQEWLPSFGDDPKTKVMKMKRGVSIRDLYGHLITVDSCFFKEIGFLIISTEVGSDSRESVGETFKPGTFYFPRVLDEICRMLADSDFSTAENALKSTSEIVGLMENETDILNAPKGTVSYEIVLERGEEREHSPVRPQKRRYMRIEELDEEPSKKEKHAEDYNDSDNCNDTR